MFNSAQFDFLEEELWVYDEKYLEAFYENFENDEEDTFTNDHEFSN